MKLTFLRTHWSLLLYILGSQCIYLSNGSSLNDGELSGGNKAHQIKTGDQTAELPQISLTFKPSSKILPKSHKRSKGRRHKDKKSKWVTDEFLTLNEHPDHIDAYEIQKVSLPEPSIEKVHKKPERVKKKSVRVDDSNKTTWSSQLAEARTLLLAPLLAAAPMMFAEVMTLGGVGMAVPALILLPLLLLPLAVISFIIFI